MRGQFEALVYYLLDSLCVSVTKEELFLLLSALSSIFGKMLPGGIELSRGTDHVDGIEDIPAVHSRIGQHRDDHIRFPTTAVGIEAKPAWIGG